MRTETRTKSANYLQIVCVLRGLLKEEKITPKEYQRAKGYYQKLTGADIVILD